ncbi:MAG: hypothetical protein GZ091_15605 [Paludibacter sp.]|nr:hypothetical protein [Paludibacter sp.]
MKNIKFLIAFTLVLISTVAIAQKSQQDKITNQTNPVFDQMAIDLKLTQEQRTTVQNFWVEKTMTVNEKVKAANTDEEKAEVRKASYKDYFQKLKDNFGQEMMVKMRVWHKENNPKFFAPKKS